VVGIQQHQVIGGKKYLIEKIARLFVSMMYPIPKLETYHSKAARIEIKIYRVYPIATAGQRRENHRKEPELRLIDRIPLGEVVIVEYPTKTARCYEIDTVRMSQILEVLDLILRQEIIPRLHDLTEKTFELATPQRYHREAEYDRYLGVIETMAIENQMAIMTIDTMIIRTRVEVEVIRMKITKAEAIMI